MRFLIGLVSIAAMLLVASAAGAALTWTTEVSVDSGRPLQALLIGDVVTIDVTLRSDGELTLGLGGAASGYDTSVVSFVSGQAVDEVLTTACFPALGCLGGMANLTTNFPITEDTTNPAGPFVQILLAVDIPGVTNTGATDEGFNGIAGSAQFQVVFQATGIGETEVGIGADPDWFNILVLSDGSTGISNNDQILINVVPEPGTAVLLGLGLVGLARPPRRN